MKYKCPLCQSLIKRCHVFTPSPDKSTWQCPYCSHEDQPIAFDREEFALTLKGKLEALSYSLLGDEFGDISHEDAAKHLCDLLEYCRLHIDVNNGMIHGSLRSMVANYGENPMPPPSPEK